jgi:hypothetical protein
MNKQPYLHTFEWDSKNEILEVHANQQGLVKLINSLEILMNSVENNHVHLMTLLWGGDELSSEIQSENNDIINHVKIIKWE